MSYNSGPFTELQDFIGESIKEVNFSKIGDEIVAVYIVVEGKEIIIRASGNKLLVFAHERGEDFDVRITG